MATTCNKVTDFSTLVEGINKTSGAACILALVDVVPGDEPAACGMFALNKMATKAATIMEMSCKLLPLNPTVLKVYFGEPCLKTISDINPTADQTSVETRAIFKNNLDKAYVLKLLVDKGVKKVAESMKLALLPQTFIDTATGDLSKNISELLVTTGSAFGLNLDTPFDAIDGDGPIDSKYIKWTISNPIVEIKGNKLYSSSSGGKTVINAQITSWPVPLIMDVKSLDIPFRASSPPKISASSTGTLLKCKNSMLFDYIKVGDFSIHDDDADIMLIEIYNKYNSGLGPEVNYLTHDHGPHTDVTGYLTQDQIFKTPGSATLNFRAKDICGNEVTLKDAILVSWTQGESLCAATHDILSPYLKITSGHDMENVKSCPFQSIKECESKNGGYPSAACYQKLGSKLPSLIPRNQNRTGPKGAEFSRDKWGWEC